VDKAAALAVVAQLSQRVETAAPAEDARPLPKCKDRDDQKFLELAHAAQADWLVSKDRAVLKLAKRIARDFGFQIAQPAPFVDAIALAGSAHPLTHSTPLRTAP
jgi:predicted nucleic acid-binding protein